MSTENEIVNSFKELSDKIAENAKNDLTELKKVQIDPLQNEIKSLKEQNAKLEEKLNHEVSNTQKSIDKIELAINKGFASNNKVEAKKDLINDKKTLENIVKALESRQKINLTVEEYKAIRFSDATTTGDFTGAPVKYGEIDINKQVNTDILLDIDTLPAISKNDGDVAWDGYDESLIDIYDSNEMDAAKLSEAIKKSEIKLNLKQYQAKMIISNRVIMDPAQIGTLDRNIAALEGRYNRKIASQVYQDIIQAANAGSVGKVASTTTSAPADSTARLDLRKFPGNLKVDFVNSAVLYISRTFLTALFSQEVSDGHLPIEQFVANVNSGINSFFTVEKNIPIRVFEHAQIGNYKSLADGSSDITTDYVSGGSNQGKLLAFVGDLKSYKLIPSTINAIGYDTGFGALLSGAVPAGRIGYNAQGLVAKERIKVLYAKAA